MSANIHDKNLAVTIASVRRKIDAEVEIPFALFTSNELDRLSAILSDYIAQTLRLARELREYPATVSASEILHKHVDDAADLRDKIENRE